MMLRLCCLLLCILLGHRLCKATLVRRGTSNDEALEHPPHRELSPLQVVVGSFGTPYGPLQKCQGDCDFDFECLGSLKCFQRNANEAVPGCADTSGVERYGMDFCYDENDAPGFSAQSSEEESAPSPPAQSQALSIVVGILTAPPEGKLLGKCEGDCDWDSECAEGLVCFYRSDNTPVPGCYGDTVSKYSYDFCYDPNEKSLQAQPNPSPTSPPPPQPVPSPTLPPQPLPTSRAPTPRPTNAPVKAPQPTVPASEEKFLQVLVGVGASLPNGKLGKCQGDCDSDDECAGNLLCRQRNDNSPVPGCTGEWIGYRTGIDFCYDPADVGGVNPPPPTQPVSPPNPQPTPQPVPPPTPQPVPSPTSPPVPPLTPQPVPSPTPRPVSPPPPVPQPTPRPVSPPPVPQPTPRPVSPPPVPQPIPQPLPPSIESVEEMTPGTNFLEIIGDDNVSDLPRCKGDCDSDDQCFGDFVCYQKYSPDTYVPGCFGIGEDLTDYCIDPRDNPSNIHRDQFRLKLFWRTGYMWQEEPIERKWCIECAGRVCNAGDELVISKCDDDGSNEEFHFVFRNGLELSIQVAGTDLCFEAPTTNLGVRLAYCDSWKPEQRFRPGIGDWDWDRFELESVSAPGCITQRHHPKEGEPLFREDCDVARNDRTSLWNKYM